MKLLLLTIILAYFSSSVMAADSYEVIIKSFCSAAVAGQCDGTATQTYYTANTASCQKFVTCDTSAPVAYRKWAWDMNSSMFNFTTFSDSACTTETVAAQIYPCQLEENGSVIQCRPTDNYFVKPWSSICMISTNADDGGGNNSGGGKGDGSSTSSTLSVGSTMVVFTTIVATIITLLF
ncbi:hypothetical protein DFA_04486 [Cavenderia fasciculata]|uniref:Transmembrane protein n=1 Tax=Cavenderia fasciculata TaxID=261658 RepID=F4PPQ5_CACFS|nr:uncharacterized protein DFA_04486 [Cavenderia fasciculata]EGG22368.1 hypothetical protein DFA_04486 [Cavenderia fasciculata]|eukprot:XP_004360219.1 hypothetical protein DFA_04486 [Cavenderia fasciculata]